MQLRWWQENIGHYVLADITSALIAEQRDQLSKTITEEKPVLHDHHELVGIDLGYTEVLTDHLGNCYLENLKI